MSQLLVATRTPQSTSISISICGISISLLSLPKDILLRTIAPLLEDDELIGTARCTRTLMTSLQHAQLRHPHTLRDMVHHRPAEMSEFIRALSSEEVEILKTSGWQIEATGKATKETRYASSLSSPTIGIVTSLRIQLNANRVDHAFLLPHLNRLPRSIRAVSFTTDPSVIYESNMMRLTLSPQLTSLKFGMTTNIPHDVIESLTHLESLEIPMHNLLRDKSASSSNGLELTSSSSLTSSSVFKFSSSLRRLIIPSWKDSVLSFEMPSELTHLSISSRTDHLEYVLSHLPARLKVLHVDNRHYGKREEYMKCCIDAIEKNLIPPSVEVLSFTEFIERPLLPASSDETPTPIVWHNSTIRTLKLAGYSRNKGNQGRINLPIDPLTGISRLTSLTLPSYHSIYEQLLELTSLTHLAEFYPADGTAKDVIFPPALEHLQFHLGWVRSLVEWNPPPRLHTLDMGECWNMPLTSLRLPPTITHLRFGASFERPPPPNYVWPPHLKSLTLESSMKTHWPAFIVALPAGCRLFVPSHLSPSGRSFGRLTEYRADHEFVRQPIR